MSNNDTINQIIELYDTDNKSSSHFYIILKDELRKITQIQQILFVIKSFN